MNKHVFLERIFQEFYFLSLILGDCDTSLLGLFKVKNIFQ
jgi:hypothetical protein